MSKKPGHRKAAKALIDPAEPRADMGPRPWPTEAEMLRRLEQRQERVWSSTANRPDIGPHLHGGGNGRVSHKRNEY